MNFLTTDGILYHYLLSLSIKEENEIRVYKSNLPPIKQIASILKVKSRQTVYNHFNSLLTQGYIKDKEKFWLLEVDATNEY